MERDKRKPSRPRWNKPKREALEGSAPKPKKPCVEQEVEEESSGNVDEDSDRSMVQGAAAESKDNEDMFWGQ